MAHLLSTIDYEAVEAPVVDLPAHPVRSGNYRRPPRELSTCGSDSSPTVRCSRSAAPRSPCHRVGPMLSSTTRKAPTIKGETFCCTPSLVTPGCRSDIAATDHRRRRFPTARPPDGVPVDVQWRRRCGVTGVHEPCQMRCRAPALSVVSNRVEVVQMAPQPGDDAGTHRGVRSGSSGTAVAGGPSRRSRRRTLADLHSLISRGDTPRAAARGAGPTIAAAKRAADLTTRIIGRSRCLAPRAAATSSREGCRRERDPMTTAYALAKFGPA
jgi:hypothetical protein